MRTLILTGGTAIDVPFFSRFAVNAQRALDQLATLCASDRDCRKTFPGLGAPVRRASESWNAHPAPMTGNQLASVVQFMLLDLEKAVSIPLVISRATAGDLKPPRASRRGGSRRRPEPHRLVDLV